MGVRRPFRAWSGQSGGKGEVVHHPISELFDTYAHRQGLPIIGVRIGSEDDRSTWSLQFSDDATQSDRDKEAATIQNFDEEAETVIAHGITADSQLDDPVISALITVLSSTTNHTADELRELVKIQLTGE